MPDQACMTVAKGYRPPERPRQGEAEYRKELTMIREIVTIDEALCDGCGLCVPACHEAALQIVDGKARIVADKLCDGMGACLGHCPQGAIRIEQREADEFDEQAVAARQAADALRQRRQAQTQPAGGHGHGGCPGSAMMNFERAGSEAAAVKDDADRMSALRHWPVQLKLLPATAPVLREARLLVAADCVPVAYAGFHDTLLPGHAVVVACPKLDDTTGYVEKLAAMIRDGGLKEITVAHMEVPCCGGIVQAVLAARQMSGRDIPIKDVTISVQGQILRTRVLTEETVVL